MEVSLYCAKMPIVHCAQYFSIHRQCDLLPMFPLSLASSLQSLLQGAVTYPTMAITNRFTAG